ncbi:MAG TPA: MFS transporter [Bryobacteraceae bacterium]|nr:MFS transporter [Bryobacteraceae bacterium]
MRSVNVETSVTQSRSPLLPIFLIVMVDVLGLTIILPLLPFYAERLGASPTVVGLLVSTYAACQLIAGPVLGQMSDHMGRRPLLLVSQMGTFIGFLILAWAGSAGLLWMVFLSRIIDGLTAGNLSLAQAYISDVTRPEERAKSFGVIGVAFGIGFLIGPAISGFLSTFGYEYPIFAAAGLSLTSILSTYFLLPSAPVVPESEQRGGPPPPAGRRLRVLDWGSYATYFKRPMLAELLWQFFAFAFAFAIFMSGFALFAERRYTWNGHPFRVKEVGYVFAYVGFLGIILQGGLIGRLVKRFGEEKLVAAGFVSATAGFALIGFAYHLPSLLVASTIASFGTGVLRPALTSLITQRAGRDEQGVILGLTQSLMSIAQITAPVIAGYLIDRGLLMAWALVGAAVAAAGVAIEPVKLKVRSHNG